MEYRSGLVAFASLAFVSLVLVSAACSSSSSGSSTAADAGDGGLVITVNEDLCKKTGNYEDCFQCCNPGDGYLVGQQAFQNCMCQGACKTPCATSVCVDPDGGIPADETDDCSNCLDSDPSATTCAQTAQTTCAGNADCARFTQCINDACEALPDLDGGH